MTSSPRVYDQAISADVLVLVYANGDLTVYDHGEDGITFLPSQAQELRVALGRITAEESNVASLGENQVGDECYLEWDGSTVSLFDTGSFPTCIELSKKDATALKEELINLGH